MRACIMDYIMCTPCYHLFYVHMTYMYSDSECIAINGYGCITSIEIKYAMAIVLVFLSNVLLPSSSVAGFCKGSPLNFCVGFA